MTAKFRFLPPLADVEPRAHEESVRRWTVVLCAVIAAVGRKMAYRPGISGKIFAALGEADVNIRMINQGPDELNIIFGVDNADFEKAIRVLYNSFVK